MDRTTFNLNVIEVVEPCPAPWDEMNGDAQARFCAHCQRHVHDLSAMTRADAVDLICRNAGNLCVRFARAEDGAIKTLDYAPASRGWNLKRWLCLSALLGIAVGAGNYLWGRAKPQPPMIAGAMMVPIAPPPAPAGTQSVNCRPAGS